MAERIRGGVQTRISWFNSRQGLHSLVALALLGVSSEQAESLVSEKMRPSKYPEPAGEWMRASAALGSGEATLFFNIGHNLIHAFEAQEIGEHKGPRATLGACITFHHIKICHHMRREISFIDD